MPKKQGETASPLVEKCVICLTVNQDVTSCALDHYIYGKPPMLILDLLSFCVPEFVGFFLFCEPYWTLVFCFISCFIVTGAVPDTQVANVLGVHYAADGGVQVQAEVL